MSGKRYNLRVVLTSPSGKDDEESHAEESHAEESHETSDEDDNHVQKDRLSYYHRKLKNLEETGGQKLVEAYKSQRNVYGREYRKKLKNDEEKLLRHNRLSRERVKKYRARKKSERENVKLTRQEQKKFDEERERQREQWRLQKAEQRKRAKEKAAAADAEEKAAVANGEEDMGRNAVRAAKSRILKALPKDPTLCAEALSAVLESLSPDIKVQGYSSPKTSRYHHSCQKVVERMTSEEKDLRSKRNSASVSRRKLILDFLSEPPEDVDPQQEIVLDEISIVDIENLSQIPLLPAAADNMQDLWLENVDLGLFNHDVLAVAQQVTIHTDAQEEREALSKDTTEAETLSKDTTEALSKDIPESLSEDTTEAETLSEDTTEALSEDRTEALSEDITDTLGKAMTEALSEEMRETVSEDMTDALGKDTSDALGQDMTDSLSKDMKEAFGKDTTKALSEDTIEAETLGVDTAEILSTDTTEAHSDDTTEILSKDTTEILGKGTPEALREDTTEAETLSVNTADILSKNTTEVRSDNIAEILSKDTTEILGKDRSENLTEACSEDTTKNLSEDTTENLSEDMTENLSEDKKEYVDTSSQKKRTKGRKILIPNVKIRSTYFKSRGRAKRRKSSDLTSNVIQFYEREDNSVQLPLPQKVNKKGKPRSILRYTTATLHKHFLQETNAKISIRKFQKLRPNHVKLSRSTPWIQCLCMTCENVRQMIVSLRNYSPEMKERNITNVWNWNAASLCPKVSAANDFNCNRTACVNRECPNCGLETLQSSIAQSLPKKDIGYWMWTKVRETKAEKTTTRVIKERKTVSATQLLNNLVAASHTLSRHLHNASWQHRFYIKKSRAPNAGELVLLTDFSENIRLEHQNQPQAVHWGYKQATLCPMVMTYICPDDNCNKVVKHVVTAVSDDLKHDYFHAEACENAAVALVRDSIGVNIDKVIKINDGAPGTYKCRQMLHLTALSNTPVERHYFGSSHGKSLSDGEGAVAKKIISESVRTETSFVDSAEAVVKTLNQHYHTPSQIHPSHTCKMAVLVSDIKRPKLTGIAPVKGLQRYHSIKRTETGKLELHQLSCFCQPCLDGERPRTSCEEFVGKSQIVAFGGVSSKPCAEDVASTRKRSTATSSSVEPGKRLKLEKPHAEDVHSTRKRKSTTTISSAKPGKKLTTELNEDVPPFQKKIKLAATCSALKPGKKVKMEETHIGDRKTFFEQLQAILLNQKSHKDFKMTCEKYQAKVDEFSIEFPVSSLAGDLLIDLAACELYPEDGIENYVPRQTCADGNCLFHAVAQALWKESRAYVTELRVRTAMELITHEKLYLDNSYLQKGLDKTNHRDLPKIFASYLDEYMVTKLTSMEVARLFRANVQRTTKNSEYCSIWHIFGLSSVLKHPIHALYPKFGGYTVRGMLQRKILPRDQTAGGFPLHLMWSHTNGRIGREVAWRPNHFVTVGEAVKLESFLSSPRSLSSTSSGRGNFACG